MTAPTLTGSTMLNAELHAARARIAELERDGPTEDFGTTRGDGEAVLETMRHALEMSRLAARTEAELFDEERAKNKQLEQQLAERTRERDEHARWRADLADKLHDVEAERAAAVRRADEYHHALIDIRLRLHAAGRRPEECYEMSAIDAAIDAAMRGEEGAA